MCAPPRFVVILGGVTFWHGACSQRRANLIAREPSVYAGSRAS